MEEIFMHIIKWKKPTWMSYILYGPKQYDIMEKENLCWQ